MYPKKFQNMIDSYQKLPGVGKKTAERYAFKTLDWDEETLDQFIQSLTDLKKGITYCHICGNLSEEDICDICKNKNRNHNCICVVQNPKNIDSIEAMQEFNGVYHVLNGTINVSKGVLPEQLNTIFDQSNQRGYRGSHLSTGSNCRWRNHFNVYIKTFEQQV